MALWHIPWTPIADYEMWILNPAGLLSCFLLGKQFKSDSASIYPCVFHFFSSTVKTAEPPPPLLSHFLFISVQLTSVSFISAKIFQNWSTPAGYEESVGGFEPIRKGENF